ncbi:MAG: nucleoside triphosphate pyrophosphatase [Thiomicrospira sp.]
MQTPKILLASSSIYRQQLLQKLGIQFECAAPDIDESPLEGETVSDMVMRLSLQKALALRNAYPQHYIIASDQSACLDGFALGKPGNHDAALAQLRAQQGKTLTFFTGLIVLAPNQTNPLSALDTTEVHFRQLSDEQIEAYLQQEKPYQCVGSFKSEGLGIVLFESIKTQDPNALIGLPLIQLVSLLSKAGLTLPTTAN